MTRLLAAAAILILTVFALLGAAAWNRTTETPVLTLTEREIEVWGNPANESSELRLRVRYHDRSEPLDARAWLPEAKLEELGFPTAVPANAPEAERSYLRALPRLGYVALEFDGPAWQAIARERALKGGAGVDGVPSEPNRLVPIDAGRDREALQRRHQGQPVMIVPAVFGLHLNRPTEGAFLWGTLDRLVTEDLSGSIRLRRQLRELPAGPRRYEADVAVGRLGVPRVVAIRPR